MYLRYNFVMIKIEGSSLKWKKYINDLLSEQIDFSCEFASSTPIQDDLKVEIRNINEIHQYQVSDNLVNDKSIGVAIDFDINVLIYYCGFSRSISLSYLISQALLRTGRGMLLHCAALEDRDGHGHVYSALGGVGKTQLALSLVSNGNFRLLGDDLVICSIDGQLFPYLRPLCLYNYHYSLLSIKLPKHYFLGPDFIYKILRRFSHLSMRFFGTRKWFTLLRSFYTGRNLSNDIPPSVLFANDQLSCSGVKFVNLYAVTVKQATELFNEESFVEFVLNTTIPEWVYFDGMSEQFCKGFGVGYRDLMFNSIKSILKNVDINSMGQISKGDLEKIYA